MIIACPSCQTRFNVDSAKLQPAGRKVRCAKCEHRWHQMPEDQGGMDTDAPASAPAEPPAAEPPAAEPPVTEPSDATEDHPPSPPETPAAMAESLAAIAEQVAGAGYTVTESKSQAMQPNPIQRVVQRAGAVPSGPFTVPPRMRPMRPAKRRSSLGLILIAGFIIGLLVAGYVFRDTIARTVPGADLVFSVFGLSTDDPAQDIEISNITAVQLPSDGGRRIFQVKATLFNSSDYPVAVPPLLATPMDAEHNPLAPIAFRVPERVIEPGQNINFQKSFDNLPPTAVRVALSFAAQP